MEEVGLDQTEFIEDAPAESEEAALEEIALRLVSALTDVVLLC